MDRIWNAAKWSVRTRRIRIWAAMVIAAILLLITPGFAFDVPFLTGTSAGWPTAALLLIFTAALGCEFIDSSLGMGYGTTLTPLLLLVGYEPLQIVPSVLLSEAVTGLAAGLMHHRDGNVDFLKDPIARRSAILLSALSSIGALAAVFFALNVPQHWLKAIIAIIIFSAGIVTLATFRRRLRYRPSHLIALGAVAAFNKGLSGGGYGLLVTAGQMVSGVSPKQAVAITSLAEALTCVVGLGAYIALHGTIHWPLAIALTLGATLSVPLATLTVRTMRDSALRCSVGTLTCLLAILTLISLF